MARRCERAFHPTHQISNERFIHADLTVGEELHQDRTQQVVVRCCNTDAGQCAQPRSEVGDPESPTGLDLKYPDFNDVSTVPWNYITWVDATPSGQIWLAGRRIDALGNDEMRRIRGREIGAIFQDPLTSLNPLISIGDQLVETVRTHLPLTPAQSRHRLERGIHHRR